MSVCGRTSSPLRRRERPLCRSANFHQILRALREAPLRGLCITVRFVRISTAHGTMWASSPTGLRTAVGLRKFCGRFVKRPYKGRVSPLGLRKIQPCSGRRGRRPLQLVSNRWAFVILQGCSGGHGDPPLRGCGKSVILSEAKNLSQNDVN